MLRARGRAGGNVGDLVVLNGEIFKALDGGIGDTVAANGVFQGFVFTGQAGVFVGKAIGIDGAFQAVKPLVHFTAAVLLALENTAFHGRTGVFLLQGFQFDFGIDEARGFANVSAHAVNFAVKRGKEGFELAATVSYNIADVARGVINTVTLVAHGRHDFGNGGTQFGIQLEEALGAGSLRGLRGRDTVMQTDDFLAAHTALVADVFKGLLTGHAQAIPAATGEQEQNQEDEHEHSFAAKGTVVSFFFAQSQQAGKIHSFVALHKGEQSRDVVHTVFSFLIGVFLNGVTEFVHLPTKVLKVVCHNDTPLPMG